MVDKIGIIGLGLMGGSLAKSFKRHQIAHEIIAYDVNEASLVLAKEQGFITMYTTEINDCFSDCNIIFLCCPIDINIEAASKLSTIINKECLLTDIGSTKSKINAFMTPFADSISFIGGHPMTGMEKSGFTAAIPRLFENAYYVLTKNANTREDHLMLLEKIVIKIGAIPIVLNANEHDYVTAMISHFPHVLAFSLVNMVKSSDNADEDMHTLAAGGFKDITRIASSSPDMWEHICMSNRDNLIKIIEQFKDLLTNVQDNLVNQNSSALNSFFDSSKNYRDSFQNKGFGNVIKHYSLTVDVDDKPGIISAISSLLSANNINIKNIGILNNREMDNGVLEIVLYDKSSYNSCIALLEKENYTVY